MNKRLFFILIISGIFGSSCRTTSMIKYYNENQVQLDAIEKSYRKNYAVKPFTVEFNNKSFKNIFLEIFTDSLKYLYEFEVSEPRLADTLNRYKVPVSSTLDMIRLMKEIECKWISKATYYTNGKENSLIFLSVKTKNFRWPFTPQKYYILTYYAQPQYYDEEGRLLEGRRRRELRKLNGDIFKRVNSRVAYTISEHFR